MKSAREGMRGQEPIERSGTPCQVATHEAGHAAMCIILGGKLHGVTIEARRGRPPHAATQERSPTAHVLVAVAGGVAEGIRSRKQMAICEKDMQHALQVVDMRGVRRFACIASSLLRAHWPGVMALAAALLERKTLRGKEAWQVFVDGLVPPEPKRRGGKRR